MPSVPANQAPIIKIEVDWNDNGTYDNAYSDITNYVKKFSTKQGAEQDYQPLSSKGSCSLTLENSSGLFSPLLSTSPLFGKVYPKRAVRISANYPTGVYTPGNPGTFPALSGYVVIWAGMITKVKANATTKGNQEIILECQDYIGELGDVGFKQPPIPNLQSHTPIQAAVDTAFGGTIATGFWFFANQPTTSDYIAIQYGYNAPIIYPFVNAIGTGQNEILIGATIFDTIKNASMAINGGVGRGTLYSSNTISPAWATTYYSGDETPNGIGLAPTASNAQKQMLYVLPTTIGLNGNFVSCMTARTTNNIFVPQTFYGEAVNRYTVHYFRGNETSGTVAKDYALNFDAAYEFSPTLNQAGYVAEGKSILFNNAFDLVRLPSGSNCKLTGSKSFSFSFLFKPTASSTDSFLLDSFWNSSTFEVNIIFRLTGKYIEVEGFDGSNIFTSAVNSITIGNWHLITLTFDYTTKTFVLYINGSQVASRVTTAAIGSGPVWVNGSWGANTSNQYIPNAYMSDLFIHNAAYSSSDVAQIWAYTSQQVLQGYCYGALGGKTNGYPLVASMRDVNTYQYTGENWDGSTTKCIDAIGDCVISEFGRFYQKRNGQLRYLPANDLFLLYDGLDTDGSTVLPTFYAKNNSRFNLISDKDKVYNSVEVSYIPRVLGTSIVPVAKLSAPILVPGQSGSARYNGTIALPGGGQVTVKMDYVNQDTGNKAGAASIVTPLVGNTDFTANEQRDGSGVDYSTFSPQQLFFYVVPNTGFAEVTIKNIALGPLYVNTLQLRGKLIPMENALSVFAEDANSISVNGRKSMPTKTIPLDVSYEFARNIAYWLLQQFLNPFYMIDGSIDFGPQYLIGDGTAISKHVLDVDMYNIVQVQDPTITTPLNFLVRMIEYDWTPKSFKVKLGLERCDNARYMVLDHATFGQIESTYGLGV